MQTLATLLPQTAHCSRARNPDAKSRPTLLFRVSVSLVRRAQSACTCSSMQSAEFRVSLRDGERKMDSLENLCHL